MRDAVLKETVERLLGPIPEEDYVLQREMNFSLFDKYPAGEVPYDTDGNGNPNPVHEEFITIGNAIDDLAGLNIGYYPKEGKATIYVYARTDVPERRANVRMMNSRLKKLKKIYTPTEIRFEDEEQTTDSKEYQLDIPVNSEADLTRIVESVKRFAPKQSRYKESTADQLQKLFPNADGKTLEHAIGTVDAGFSNVEKVTDASYTGVVLSFDVDDKRIYGKVSADKNMLRKEAQYHHDAWTHPLMQAITPKLIGITENEKAAALFTYGTQNIGIVPAEALRAYMKKHSAFITNYAKKTGKNPATLLADPTMTDTFNLALSHTYMRMHKDNPIYSSASLDSISSVEKLEDRLSQSSNGLVKEFVQLFPLYRDVAEMAQGYDAKPTILANYDARPENVFASANGIRPRGDFSLVKPGTPEFDLAKLEVRDLGKYVDAYSYFRNGLEQESGNNFELSGSDTAELRARAPKIAFTSAVRLGAFKLSKGLRADAERYYKLAQTYSAKQNP